MEGKRWIGHATQDTDLWQARVDSTKTIKTGILIQQDVLVPKKGILVQQDLLVPKKGICCVSKEQNKFIIVFSKSMLFRDVIAVYCENRWEHKHTHTHTHHTYIHTHTHTHARARAVRAKYASVITTYIQIRVA